MYERQKNNFSYRSGKQKHSTCLVCSLEKPAICHKQELSKTRCLNGHYVCNECHTKGIDKVICEEVHRDDMVILENVDFVHHTPMTVLPVGALCEIDCERRTFTISEAGTR